MFHVSYKEYIDSFEENENPTDDNQISFKKYEYITEDDLHKMNIKSYKKTYKVDDFIYTIDNKEKISDQEFLQSITREFKIPIFTTDESFKRLILKPPFNKKFKLTKSAASKIITRNMSYKDLVDAFPFEKPLISLFDTNDLSVMYNCVTILRQYGSASIYKNSFIYEPYLAIKREPQKIYPLVHFIASKANCNFYSLEVATIY